MEEIGNGGIVSTHSRPRAADGEFIPHMNNELVSTHSRPRAAEPFSNFILLIILVSTHSRPRAADEFLPDNDHQANCFNTQPPEGG